MSDLTTALFDTRTKGGVVDMHNHTMPRDQQAAYALQTDVAVRFQSETIGWKLGATNAKTLQLLGFDPYEAYKIRRLFRKKDKETMPELYRIHRQDGDK